jgi:plastocyanin
MLLSLVLVGCGGYSADPSTPPPPPPPGGGNPTLAASVAMTSGGDPYGSSGNTFSPASVTILQTGTVTWNNNTGVLHNVTFGSVAGAPANVTNMSTGNVSRSFGTAGTFNYQCTNHPGMTGQVVVQ